jgi:hypothetical protein
VLVWWSPALFSLSLSLSLSLSFFKCLEKLIQMQTNISIQTSKMLVFYVLIWRCKKTTTNSNTNIYHPNTAIGDDVCLLHVSFNSTLQSLPLQLCSQPLTSNIFSIDRLGNLPSRSCDLDLIPSLFSIKRHRHLSVLLTSTCFLLL